MSDRMEKLFNIINKIDDNDLDDVIDKICERKAELKSIEDFGIHLFGDYSEDEIKDRYILLKNKFGKQLDYVIAYLFGYMVENNHITADIEEWGAGCEGVPLKLKAAIQEENTLFFYIKNKEHVVKFDLDCRIKEAHEVRIKECEGFSKKAIKILTEEGFVLVSELHFESKAKIEGIKGLDQRTLKNIEKVLNGFGIGFKKDS